jgi:FimV-like protein
MISIILKSYFSIILSIALGSLFVFSLGLYWIYHSFKSDNNINDDYNAIAGDDVLATQLDLARAFIETGQAVSAKRILKSVVANGSTLQQQEAQRLLSSL